MYKKIILILSATVFLISCSKTKYTISGTATGIENGKTIILESQDAAGMGLIPIDTVKVENGKFENWEFENMEFENGGFKNGEFENKNSKREIWKGGGGIWKSGM